jgi:hypothetical protein
MTENERMRRRAKIGMLGVLVGLPTVYYYLGFTFFTGAVTIVAALMFFYFFIIDQMVN